MKKFKCDFSPIELEGIRVHNVCGIDLTIPAGQLVVFTGVSGSGKSSVAFDTIYAEGQRRYVESLSNYARRFLGSMARPDVQHVSGLTPTISIEQKTAGRNPRSTVGTMTQLYDYLRVLYARVGSPHCPVSGELVEPQSKERIIKTVQALPSGSKLQIIAPLARGRKAEFKDEFEELVRKGFMRARLDGELVDLSESITVDGSIAHDVDVVVDRVVIREADLSRVAEGITSALELGEGTCITVDATTGEETLYSTHAHSPTSGLSYHALEPQDFSFNSPAGMCPRCEGLGMIDDFDLDKVINPELSIAEDCCSIASPYQTVRYGNIYDNLARIQKFDIHTPWKNLPRRAKNIFLNGTTKKWTPMTFIHPETGKKWMDRVRWRGVLNEARKRYADAKSDGYRKKMEKLMVRQQCPECEGDRLKAYPRATTLGGKTIGEVCRMSIADSASFFEQLQLDGTEALIANELLKEIQQRLQFLLDVGLDYLTLSRTAPTLSGGEAQRVRLASQIGCGLVGVTYILDEPSIGLHPRDNRKLLATLRHLRDMGNSVLVVEHDEETIRSADRVIDIGPGPGIRGGKIVVDGTLKQLLANKQSLTGDYLSGRRQIAIPEVTRTSGDAHLNLHGARHHNLDNIDVKIPLGMFVAVAGVSGSGKSSLITDILYPALSKKLHNAEIAVGEHDKLEGTENLDKVVSIDQTPIGRNPRSNPATYVKVFDEIRNLFCSLPESQARGYTSGRFSFNVADGSCKECQGMGMTKVDMDFLEDCWVECSRCHGRRFDEDTLSIHFRAKNIYDILEMEIGEALEFFRDHPKIRQRLQTLVDVGLEYLKLGQPSPTLSGGEAQRIKLAKELSRAATGKTLYLLDEPTTGLHFHDIDILLRVLHTLVDHGNTVVVIEHNMDVVKTADWVIELGPEGGSGGGQIVAANTPRKVARKRSATGIALREVFEGIEPIIKHSRSSNGTVTAITVEGAQEHNLKRVNLKIPRGKTTVLTGPSGSGKSSLALDTVYAEGQRRYADSLSPYARQYVKQQPKPVVENIQGLSPAIAVEQQVHAGSPRSTVGTMTEIYDFLRLLFARIGIPHCPDTGEVIQAIGKDTAVDAILALPEGERLHLLAPLPYKNKKEYAATVERLRRQGFIRIRLDGEYHEIDGTLPLVSAGRKHTLELVVDRIVVGTATRARLGEAIEVAEKVSDGVVIVAKDDEDLIYNLRFSVPSTGKAYPPITPHTFSFNRPDGMCPQCHGLGIQYGIDLEYNVTFANMTPSELIYSFWGDKWTEEADNLLEEVLAELSICDQPLNSLTSEQIKIFLNGSDEEHLIEYNGLKIRWPGINNILAKLAKAGNSSKRDQVIPLLDEHICPECSGSRLNALARHVTVNDHNLGSICSMHVLEAASFFDKLKLKGAIAPLLEEPLAQLRSRLAFLKQIGLGYLSLDRPSRTLSGGETQRIRLARQLGSGLTGVLYVLDEPTTGLHPQDIDRLHWAMDKLKTLGNTLLVVEHDPQTIAHADYIADFGPGAGSQGGHVVFQGSYKQLLRSKKSLTGEYLSGRRHIEAQRASSPKTSTSKIKLEGGRLNNLKDVNVEFPVGALTAVTGVSGSGKSSLVNQLLLPAATLYHGRDAQVEYRNAVISGLEQFDKVIALDQKPIGGTSRSDVGSYAEIYPALRTLYAQLPAAAQRGLMPGHFSFNHRRGMCTTCWGMGYRKIEMHFLPAVRVACDACQGQRLNPLSLEVTYLGYTFGQVMKCTVEEARQLFQNHRAVVRRLDTLIQVGLGYLQLGQQMATLSGGEAQRLKLSRELSKRSTGDTLYILDEPTTGLHSDDISKLLKVLRRLNDKGNTIVVVEHNLDMIAASDWIIDLGPEAGDKGGEVIAMGTLNEVRQQKRSLTGRYLSSVS